MFDVGFSEMVLIGIVALLVLGPERLPKVARTAGLWAGRARRFLTNVKADIDRELKAEELKQIIQKQAQSTGIHELVEQTRGTVGEIKQATSEAVASAQAVPATVTAAVSAEVAAHPPATPAASTATAPAPTHDK